MTWFMAWFFGKMNEKMQILRYLQMNWDRIGCTLHKEGTANASAKVLKAFESDFRSKIENRENRRNYAFEILTHIWHLELKIIVSKVLKHAETDSERFRAVWDLWRKFVKIDPNLDPKMVKIEGASKGLRLMNQNSDYTVLKKPKNDRWRYGPVSGCLTVTET